MRRNVGTELELGVVGHNDYAFRILAAASNRRLDASTRAPAPGVAKPQVRQEVKRRRLGSAIGRFDANADIFRRGLRILDDNVEIAIVVEDAGVDQLVLQV